MDLGRQSQSPDPHDEASAIGGSFRDPAGFVYRRDGQIFRRIEQSYNPDYEQLGNSGLYRALVDKGWLVPHTEIGEPTSSYRVIQPEMIPFVSYPYEWSFSQLKDAALLTLDIQQVCMRHGMSLKDASAYNIQFRGCDAVFIDTLSFETYKVNQPWVAYGQFCRHFLGPLALMAHKEVRLRQLLRAYIDGLPLDLIKQLLPMSTLVRYGLFAHLHLHARNQKIHQDDGRQFTAKAAPKLSRQMLLALLTSLRNTVSSLSLPRLKTEWGDYYADTNYSDDGMLNKEALVAELVTRHFEQDVIVHDVGGNTGRFSRLVAATDRRVVSHDIDELAVEENYRVNRQTGQTGVLPLVLDLTNPSPALGWGLAERDSTIERMRNSSILALALIHHLAIGNNTPLTAIAQFFSQIADRLIIEFVPKEDSQVRRMLATRPDIFPQYNVAGFTEAFERYFEIREVRPVESTQRSLFAMTAK